MRITAPNAKTVGGGKKISWQDAMRMKPDLERVCRHNLTN